MSIEYLALLIIEFEIYPYTFNSNSLYKPPWQVSSSESGHACALAHPRCFYTPLKFLTCPGGLCTADITDEIFLTWYSITTLSSIYTATVWTEACLLLDGLTSALAHPVSSRWLRDNEQVFAAMDVGIQKHNLPIICHQECFSVKF